MTESEPSWLEEDEYDYEVEVSAEAISYVASPTGALFHKSNALLKVIMGPVGSGKSVTCCFEIFRQASLMPIHPATGWRESRWVIIRNTYPELIGTTMKTWQEWFGSLGHPKLSHPITVNIKIPELKVNLEIEFLAVSGKKDEKKLLSREVTGVWVNEGRELPFEVYQALIYRLRFPNKKDVPVCHKCIIVDTNAPDEHNWIYQKFETGKVPKNMEIFKQPPAVYKDQNGDFKVNEFAENIRNVGVQYYQNMIDVSTEDYVRVYGMGEYGYTRDGKPVYPEFSSHLHVSPQEISYDPNYPVGMGLDFGLDPCCVFVQYIDRRLYVLGECGGTDISIDEFCSKIFLPYVRNRFPNATYTAVGDPSGNNRKDTDASFAFQVLSKHGINAFAARSNSIKRRLDSVKNVLNKLTNAEPMCIISPTSKTLIEGLNGRYVYERINSLSTEGFKELPKKDKWSHIQDAFQYICMHYVGELENVDIKKMPYQKPAPSSWMSR